MPRIKFFTVGCKVNQYETQLLRERILYSSDFKEVNSKFPADIYIINTCTVTHRADSDSFSLIRRAKRENPKAKIIVTGCLTELDEAKIRDIDSIDLVVKNKDKFKIPFLFTSLVSESMSWDIPIRGISYFKNHTRAFLKIQEGCNNFCSYCKVPLVRGSSRSKNPQDVIAELMTLIKNGYKEIVLCGICLGSYGKDLSPSIELVDLLMKLDDLEGDFRIRLSSIEAWDITERFLQNIDKIKKLCPHLHIPIQSGDQIILSRMNRPINPGRYLEIIKKLKEKIPFLVITTDVLVGFPGEKEDNFINTLNLIKKIRPLKVHIFSYSPRPQTKAFFLNDRVDPQEIKKRVDLLKKITEDLSWQLKQDFLGLNMRVLFESYFNKNSTCFWEGLTDNYLKVKVKSKQFLKNQFRFVELEAQESEYIIGRLLE